MSSNKWNNVNSRKDMSKSNSENILDRQNQQMTENLAMKVATLKNLAFDIETESKDSNRYLDDMNSDFSSTSSLLSGGLKRINNMVASGKNNRKLSCYIVLGLILTFFILYYIANFFSTS